MLAVVQTGPEHAERLEELQRIVFPTLADAQRFKAAHYRAHVAMFPEGQWAATTTWFGCGTWPMAN